jgi:predicted nucleic acid-binding protein
MGLMALPGRLYLDANILIHLLEGNDALASALAALFVRAWRRNLLLVTSELTLAEVLVVPIRERRSRMIKRYDDLLRSNVHFEVSLVDRSVLHSAASLRASYRSLKLPDAVHLGTALKAGCSHFLTADLKLNGLYDHDDGTTEIVRPQITYLDALATERDQ